IPYRFLHDRVQQAAYFLIPDAQKQSTHLKIGRLLSSNIPEEAREDRIFDIVNQLNIGIALIEDRSERDELAQFNLIAGQKAKASTAYTAAADYLAKGRQLLPENSWESHYPLTLDLYSEAAESAYLNGDFEQTEILTQSLLENAKTLLDSTKAYEVQIQAYQAQNQLLTAVNIAVRIVNLLGITIPENPTPANIQTQLEETKARVGDRPNRLVNLPSMSDPVALAAMRILSNVVPAVHQAAPHLYPFVACQMVNLSVQYGNTAESTFGYAIYGVTQLVVLGDIAASYAFGQIGLQVLEKLHVQTMRSRTVFVFCFLLGHWQEPLKNALTPLQVAYQSGLETGDIDHAAYSIYLYDVNSYFMGKELSELAAEMVLHRDAIARLQQQHILQWHEIYRQTVLNWLGNSQHSCQLVGEAFDETLQLPILSDAEDRTALLRIYLSKAMLSYCFQDLQKAHNSIERAGEYLQAATGQYEVPLFHFYDSLISLAIESEQSGERSEKPTDELTGRLSENQEKMRKWSELSPQNHLHKYYLVEAEWKRARGKAVEVMELYDRAIASA
ncbi:MAG: serine/threonine protein kinase, partial [Cyanobacteriota bacterium]|nr:serine/threonine protein kinase [Cyanobacteriota bacterium]